MVCAWRPRPTIWPCLNYQDALGAIRFLVDVVGFTEGAVHTDESGRHVEHAELVWPEGGGVMLGSVRRDGRPFEQLPTGTSGVYVVTDRAEDVHRRAAAAGADVVEQLQTKAYGGSGFVIRDPEGNLWSFGSYRPAQP
jgi:uncharacterized glyoxalase superfamily protein PhnB